MDVKDLDRFAEMLKAEFRAEASAPSPFNGAMSAALMRACALAGLSDEEVRQVQADCRPEPPVSNGPGPFRSMVLVAMPTSMESARERYAEPAAKTLVADLRRQGAKTFGPLEIEPNDYGSVKIIAVGRA